MADEKSRGGLSAVYKMKLLVVKASLIALGVAFELVSKYDKALKSELIQWGEGRVFALGVLPDGPVMAVRKEGDHLVYLGQGDHGARLKIMFKNVDSAFLTLSAQIGPHVAFAQHRAIVVGSIYQAMEANRAMAIVQGYLMPGIVMNRIVKRKAPFSVEKLKNKAIVMMQFTPALLLNMNK